MNINIRDILTLDDDNRYVVVSRIYYNGKDYLYLVDVENNENLKICYLDGEELVENNSKDLNTELLPLFFGKVKNILKEEKI